MANVSTDKHSSPDRGAHDSKEKRLVDIKDAAVHSWPDSALSESRTGLWIARIACLILSGIFIASLFVMAKGAWPTEDLRRRCADPNDKSVGCADLEGQSSSHFNVH